MTAMRERAARALWEAARDYAPTNRPSWHDAPKADKEMAYDMVRAVLMAVREPSRVEQVWIMDGPLKNCSPDVAEDWRREYERTWIAMVDAILNQRAAS